MENNDSLNLIATSVSSLSANVSMLVGEIQKDEALRTQKVESLSRLTRLNAILIVVVVLVCGLLSYQIYSGRQDTAKRSAIAAEQRAKAQESINVLNDCIQPTGKCYKRALAIQQKQSRYNAGLSYCIVIANHDPVRFNACLKELDKQ